MSHRPTQSRFAEFPIVGAAGDQTMSYTYRRRRRQHRSNRRMKEMIMFEARAVAFPTVKFNYTSSFQYSLTSYLRTSSTQVVSSPCRGISRL